MFARVVASAAARRGGGEGKLHREGLSHVHSRFESGHRSEIQPSPFNALKELSGPDHLQKKEGDRSGFSGRLETSNDFDATRAHFAESKEKQRATSPEHQAKQPPETDTSSISHNNISDTSSISSNRSEGSMEGARTTSSSSYMEQLEKNRPRKLTKDQAQAENNEKKLEQYLRLSEKVLLRDPHWKDQGNQQMNRFAGIQSIIGFANDAEHIFDKLAPNPRE